MYKHFANINNIRTLLFANTTPKQTILKNTFWLGGGMAVTKLLSLVLIIYAARILGAEGYGQFTFALAFVSLFTVFSNLGVSSIIVREFAHDNEQREQLYSLISLKLVLAVGTFLLVGIASLFVTPSQDIQAIILILILSVLFNSVVDIFYSFFHARQKMEYEAWFEMVQTSMIVGLGLFILFHFPSPVHLSYAYLTSAFATLIFVFALFHWKTLPLKVRWDILVWRKFLGMSWPLALMGLFGAVYSYTDSVMLGYWGMMEETGWYNAAYKIVMASLVPMGFIGASFYPALSRFFAESREKFQRAWDYELEIMIALALPLVVGGLVLAHKIIESFYPTNFAPSILAFQILIGTAGLIFLYRPFYDAMIVQQQQEKTFWITVVGAVVNVILNLVLIPQYSLYGAAIATVFTHALVLSIIVFLTKRFISIQFPVLRIGLTCFIAGLATLAMYAVLVYLLAYNLHIFFLIPMGAAVYFLTFFFLRAYLVLKYFNYVYV